MKKCLAVFVCTLIAFSAFAQSADSDRPIKDVTVSVNAMPTPIYTIEGIERSNKEVRRAKDWLFITVDFWTTVPSAKSKWPKWLDGVEIEVDVLAPIRNGDEVAWGVFHGKQVLMPVCADGKLHHARFVLPSALVYKHLDFGKKFTNIEKDQPKINSYLKKVAKEYPAMASISYGGSRPIRGYQKMGRTVQEKCMAGKSVFRAIIEKIGSNSAEADLEKTRQCMRYISSNRMSPKGFLYRPNDLFSVENTPFVWVDFDRYEMPRTEQGSR